jgi:hypothetical protein
MTTIQAATTAQSGNDALKAVQLDIRSSVSSVWSLHMGQQ